MFHLFHFSEVDGKKCYCQNKCHSICHGTCPQNALNSHECGKYEHCGDKEKYLTGKAEYCREHGLAYCLEEYAAYQLEAVYAAEHKECAHTFYGKLVIKLRLAAEDAYYRHGGELEKQECAYEHRFCNDKCYFQSFLYSVGLTAAVVEAEYGLCACGKTYYNGYHYLVDLHGDAHGGHGYLGTVYAHCAVLYQQVVGNCHYQHYGHLGDKAGNAHGAYLFNGFETGSEIFFFQLDVTELEYVIPHAHCGVYELTQDSCDGCALDSPLEHEDEQRVADEVDDASCQQACHAELGAAVCTDNARIACADT